uniref:type I restriction-modification enzyme R subunit C-terminal domain-containing protein n=1 Tax=uncultured Winogradskyella sp. TaxID=395353 RepID=UPI00261A9D89
FKQIVGRGTRLFDGKDYFTVYDFVKAHEHFNDPEWDGEPEPPETLTGGGIPKPCHICEQKPCICGKSEDELCAKCDNIPCICENEPTTLIKIRLSDGKEREIDATVKTTFWSPEGKPIGHEEFMNQLFGELKTILKDEDELRKIWSLPSTRKKLLTELQEKGYTDVQLEDLRGLVKGENSDLFDVLSYVAYHKDLVPRLDRAEKAKIQMNDYSQKQQEFLNFVLEQYVRDGVEELDIEKLSPLLNLKYNSISDAKIELGDVKSIRNSFIDFQKYLYDDEAS